MMTRRSSSCLARPARPTSRSGTLPAPAPLAMAVQQRAADELSPSQPFDIHLAVERLREAVRPLPKAAMFQLADEGFASLFEQIVACIISIRTYEETTLPTARRLFAVARTPTDVARLEPSEIDRLIGACTFH